MIAVGVILLLVAVAACPGPPRRAGRFDDRQLHTTIFEALSGIEMSPHCYTMWFYSGTNFTRYLSETAGSRFSAPVGCILAQHVTGSCLPFSLST